MLIYAAVFFAGIFFGVGLWYLADSLFVRRPAQDKSVVVDAGSLAFTPPRTLPSDQEESSLSPPALDDLLQLGVELVQGDGGVLFLRHAVNGNLKSAAEYYPDADLPEQMCTFNVQTAEQAAESHQPLIEAASFDPGEHEAVKADWQVMAVPIHAQNQVMGVLTVWAGPDSTGEGKFQTEHLEKLVNYAGQTAFFMEEVNLVTRLENQLTLSNSLQNLASLLVGPKSLQFVLHEVLRQLERFVQFDSASIILMDESRGAYLAASRGIKEVEAVRREIADHADEIFPPKWLKRKTVYLPDVRKNEDWVDIPQTRYIRSWIGAVLHVRDRYIGILSIESRKVDGYDQQSIGTVRSFADQAALAIENARLFEETRLGSRRLQVLYELNNELAQTLDPGEIISRALRLSVDALEAEKADYYQYQLEDEQITLRGSYGRKPGESVVLRSFLEEHGRTSDVGWVLDHQQSVLLEDVLESELWIEIPGMDSEIRSLITVPVFIDGRLSGAISVLHSQREAFSGDEEELLMAIAQQVGLALNNAHRFREVRRLLSMLETHQALQDRLFEHLPVGVLLLDENYKILSANRKGLGHVDHLQPAFDYQQVSRLGKQTIEELIPFAETSRPLRIKEESGRATYQLQIRPVETASTLYWVLMISDVTRELEEKRMVQMQQRLATLGQFAAGIAHDFNNIISAVLVYADILERDPDLKQENLKRVSVIREQSHRAADLIRQILDFSTSSMIRREPLDLVEFLKETRDLLEHVLTDHISIQLSFKECTPAAMIEGDQTGLQQMLMNLALNARDAMPEGGQITISLSYFIQGEFHDPPIPGMESGEWVLLEFSDQGMGIPESDLAHIFEPFYTTKRSQQGTGLGLAQVYGLVKQHQGYIQVESEINRGTTFSIYFPVLDEPAAAGKKEAEQKELDGREDIVLIVEDDEDLRNALWNVLEECNFQVITAKNGAGGLNIIRQMGERISLIITDLIMPEMSGLQMIQEARKLHPEKHVLLITGHQDHLQDQQLLDDPRVDLLTKPFSLEQMMRVIQEIREKC